MSLSAAPLVDTDCDDPERLLEAAWWWVYISGRRAGELGRRLLQCTEAEPGHPLRGWGLFHSAFDQVRSGDVVLAHQAAEQARACFQRAGDARGMLLCDEVEAMRLRALERIEDAMEVHERIAAQGDAGRQPIDLYISRNSRAFTRKRLGQTDDTLRDFYHALEAAQDVASPGARINALVNLAGHHAELYSLQEAAAMNEQVLDLSEQAGAWTAFGIAALNQIETFDGLDLGPRCIEPVRRLQQHADRLPPGLLDQAAATMALAYFHAGEHAQARACIERGALAPRGEGDGKTRWARVAALLQLAAGDAQAARGLTETRLREIDAQPLKEQPYGVMRVLQVASAACEALGDTGAALSHLRRAHAAYETLMGRSARAHYIALQVRHEHAQARRERDIAQQARQAAERDRERLAALNAALQQKMRESQALQAQLREQSLRDPLTGLHNRRYLYEAAPGALALARRHKTPLSVALLDIDHFKRLNDEHGHDVGDRVLQRFAALLRERLRGSDILCRYGGEEFVLLALEADPAQLQLRLQRLLGAFAGLAIEAGAKTVTGLGFSAGVASLPGDGDRLESLLKHADDRLYRAKARGRAQVCGPEDPAVPLRETATG